MPAGVLSGVEDLAPTGRASRTWNWRIFGMAWFSMIVQPSSLSNGASLLTLGLTATEATIAHLIGGMVLWVMLCAAAWPGVKYGIPFPVICRSAFGVLGAHFCTLSRGAVALMWLSFQMWQATLGLDEALGRIAGTPYLEWARLDPYLTCGQLLLFVLFVLVHGTIVAFGVRRFVWLVYLTTPVQMCGFGVIIIWLTALCPFAEAINAASVNRTGSVSPAYADLHSLGWLAAVNASVSTWSTLVLNVCDLSRFAPSQRDQIVGQGIGLPLTYAITGFVGLWAAGATQYIYGEAMWQVPQYFATWPPLAAILAGCVLALSILAVNVLANLLSPMNDLLNLAPDRLSFRACGYACLVIAVLMCPWWLFSDQHTYVLTFLGGYASVTGAIAGVLLTDFWVLRQGTLDLGTLYRPSVCWEHYVGRANVGTRCDRADEIGLLECIAADVNWRALLAVGLGLAPCMPGFSATLHEGADAGPFFGGIYCASWFVSLGVASAFYLLLSTVLPRKDDVQRLLVAAPAPPSDPAEMPMSVAGVPRS